MEAEACRTRDSPHGDEFYREVEDLEGKKDENEGRSKSRGR
jgi:hypothetical protein